MTRCEGRIDFPIRQEDPIAGPRTLALSAIDQSPFRRKRHPERSMQIARPNRHFEQLLELIRGCCTVQKQMGIGGAGASPSLA